MSDATLEAVFITATDPASLADDLTAGLSATARELPDGQVEMTGLGPYTVLEPVTDAARPGRVTLWLRVDDAPARAGRFVDAGWTVADDLTAWGAERTISVRSPDGLVLGFVSTASEVSPGPDPA